MLVRVDLGSSGREPVHRGLDLWRQDVTCNKADDSPHSDPAVGVTRTTAAYISC